VELTRYNRVSPLEFLGILDLVSDRTGQAVRRFLSITVDPTVLQIELVLRNVLYATAVAAAVMQDRLPSALIGIVLRTRTDAPVMLEGGIIESYDLIVDRYSNSSLSLLVLLPISISILHSQLSIAKNSQAGRWADPKVQPPSPLYISTLISFPIRNANRARKCRSSDRSVCHLPGTDQETNLVSFSLPPTATHLSIRIHSRY